MLTISKETQSTVAEVWDQSYTQLCTSDIH